MRTYCIDASAMVIYLTEKKVNNAFKKILVSIEKGESIGIISTVNIAEFHRAITRLTSEDKADKYVTWIQESKIEIISPSIEIACLASGRKQEYASAKDPFAWGDAFCLATAIKYHADCIITSDDEFDQVQEIMIMKI